MLFHKRAVIKFPGREIVTRRSISCENRSRVPAEPELVKSRTGRFFNRARVSPPRSHVDKGNAFYGLIKTAAHEGRSVLRGLAKAILGGELQLPWGSEASSSQHLPLAGYSISRSILTGSMDPQLGTAWRLVAESRFVLDIKLGRRVDGLGWIPHSSPSPRLFDCLFCHIPPPFPLTSRLLLTSCL